METLFGNYIRSIQLIKEGVFEVLWPTRCVLCDTPGEVLCKRCLRHLPYIDYNTSCSRCGAPFGATLCTECNSFILNRKGLEVFPLDDCNSALMSSDSTLSMVRAFKDQHEARLAPVFASLITPLFNPNWPKPYTIVPIPARKSALRQRGFDHMNLVAQELSLLQPYPFRQVLKQGKRKDQRNLDAIERIANARNSMHVIASNAPKNVVLIDDVFTTGATLMSAAEALRAAGTTWVGAVTLVRV